MLHKKSLKFLEVARANDDTDYTLNSIVFNGNEAVATEGHRVHRVTATEPLGEIVNYPAYQKILETGKLKRVSDTSTVTELVLPALKAMALVNKCYKSSDGCKIKIEKGFLNLKYKSSYGGVGIEVNVPIDYLGKTLELCLNPSYFADAVALSDTFTIHLTTSPASKVCLLVMEMEFSALKHEAFIMPIKVS